jgi:hypothetical protein
VKSTSIESPEQFEFHIQGENAETDQSGQTGSLPHTDGRGNSGDSKALVGRHTESEQYCQAQ